MMKISIYVAIVVVISSITYFFLGLKFFLSFEVAFVTTMLITLYTFITVKRSVKKRTRELASQLESENMEIDDDKLKKVLKKEKMGIINSVKLLVFGNFKFITYIIFFLAMLLLVHSGNFSIVAFIVGVTFSYIVYILLVIFGV